MSSDGSDQQEQRLLDPELSPPLPELVTKRDVPYPHARLHPLLCRMWVGCQMLQFDPESTFTAMVLMHRYYAHWASTIATTQSSYTTSVTSTSTSTQQQQQQRQQQQQQQYDWKWIAASCLVLGIKTEETTRRRLRDVMNVAHVLQFALNDTSISSSSSSRSRTSGHDSNSHCVIDMSPSSLEPPKIDDSYWKAKKELVTAEQHVLRMLRFDTFVCHPNRIVMIIVQDKYNNNIDDHNDHNDDDDDFEWKRRRDNYKDNKLDTNNNNNKNNNSSDGMNTIIKRALTHLNDSLFYAPALNLPALVLACSAIQMALLAHIVQPKKWHESYGVTTEQIDTGVERLQEAERLLKRLSCSGGGGDDDDDDDHDDVGNTSSSCLKEAS